MFDDSRPAVLLVDDCNANLAALEALLGSPDVELQRATSGTEALRQLLQREFALVLMDVQMPGLDGFQTTELIRQRDRTRATPIIFVTAVNDRASAQRAYSLGALDYLTKPFDEALLKAKVAALVDHYQQADVIARQAEALRAKDEFLTMISHELRAPLNAILGWAAVLEADAGLPRRTTRAVQTIARNARTQSKLIDDLLDVSAMMARKLGVERRVVDLHTVAQAALTSMQPVALQRGVRLDLRVAAAPYVMLGDAMRLEQVVCNLLSNAIKFSGAGEQVLMELSRQDDRLQLRVEDNGIGMAPELLPHVFERFKQGDGGRTRRYGGLGLGLTLARHLVELHGGAVEAFSPGKHKGATFVVTLPAHDAGRAASGAPQAAAPAASLPLAGRRALIVDDDEDARDLLTMILVEAGVQVAAASSAAEALQVFESGGFDLLISDLGMPGEDGLSLIGQVRAIEARRGGAVIAVALSGYGSTGDRDSSLRAGFQAHLVKPCEPSVLLAMLTRLTQ